MESPKFFLALKFKFVKGRGYDTYESKKKNWAQKWVYCLTYENNISYSMFSIVEKYINTQQIYNSNGLYAHKSYISNNFNAAISEYKGVLPCEGYDNEHDPEDIGNPYLIPFWQGKRNC